MLVFGDHPYLRDADNTEIPSYDELGELVRNTVVEDVLAESIKVTGECPSPLCCSLISSLMEKDTEKRLTVKVSTALFSPSSFFPFPFLLLSSPHL